jgi:hypothetical protein
MKGKWPQFLFSVITVLVLPLVPLVVEYLITKKITSESWTITTAMYSISIGISSMFLPLMGVTVIISMIFISLFGCIKAGVSPATCTDNLAFILIMVLLFTEGIERYIRHVANEEVFLHINE